MQSTATMDPEQQKRWDDWCDARIEKMWRDVSHDAIAQFVSQYVRERIEAETTKLRQEIAGLRADIELTTDKGMEWPRKRYAA